MKADPDTQRRLLDLQAIDTAADQLAHRRKTLPEHDEIAGGQQKLAEQDETLGLVRADLAELDKRIRKLETEVEQTRAHADRDRKRMDSGSVPGKELERLSHEVETLKGRQSELEDQELELMEEREEIQARLDAAEAERARTQAAVDAATERRDAAYTEIDAELVTRAAEREELLPRFAADLLKLYEQLRGRFGNGAALLRGKRCEGCRMELPGSELAVIAKAPADEVLRHEDCGRILIRPAEPGR